MQSWNEASNLRSTPKLDRSHRPSDRRVRISEMRWMSHTIQSFNIGGNVLRVQLPHQMFNVGRMEEVDDIHISTHGNNTERLNEWVSEGDIKIEMMRRPKDTQHIWTQCSLMTKHHNPVCSHNHQWSSTTNYSIHPLTHKMVVDDTMMEIQLPIGHLLIYVQWQFRVLKRSTHSVKHRNTHTLDLKLKATLFAVDVFLYAIVCHHAHKHTGQASTKPYCHIWKEMVSHFRSTHSKKSVIRDSNACDTTP